MHWRRYVQDGVVEKEVERHAFVVRVRMCGTSHDITIPADIVKSLEIKKGDLVEVIIRKIDEETATKEYGYIPEKKIRQTLRVKCPICGEEGVVLFKREGLALTVLHRRRRHYIPRLLYPEFYAETYAKLLEIGRIPEDVKEKVKQRMNEIIKKYSPESKSKCEETACQ